MTVGELIEKLGEMPVDTPVKRFVVDKDDSPYWQYEIEPIEECEYDEKLGVVVLS